MSDQGGNCVQKYIGYSLTFNRNSPLKLKTKDSTDVRYEHSVCLSKMCSHDGRNYVDDTREK